MSNLEYTPAETLTVQLLRPDSGVSWGFRLQGGVDFSTPLSIQSVNPHSVAERSGIQAGDGIIYINNTCTDELTHEQAKMEIIRAGNSIVLTVQRGAVQIWKPKVTPMSELRPQQMNPIKTATGDEVRTVQKTSLTRENVPYPQGHVEEPLNIGSGHNRSAQPFRQRSIDSPKQAVPNVVHAQFNSPIGLYSAENIAHTYSAQTEGIQAQMEELDIDRAPLGTKMTGTYQVVDKGDEAEVNVNAHDDSKIPDQSDDALIPQQQFPEVSNNNHKCDDTNKPINAPDGFRSVRAPEPVAPSQSKPKQESMYCGACGMLITGVFVRVRGVPYHPQCFKCAACGVNLKQKGYFVIEGRLYCEIHAKQVAQPPSPDMKAVPVYR